MYKKCDCDYDDPQCSLNKMKKTNARDIVEDFADKIKDDPEYVIAWCRTEIIAYETLIKILTDRISKDTYIKGKKK